MITEYHLSQHSMNYYVHETHKNDKNGKNDELCVCVCMECSCEFGIQKLNSNAIYNDAIYAQLQSIFRMLFVHINTNPYDLCSFTACISHFIYTQLLQVRMAMSCRAIAVVAYQKLNSASKKMEEKKRNLYEQIKFGPL